MSRIPSLSLVVALVLTGCGGGGGDGGGTGGPPPAINPLTQAFFESIFNDSAIAPLINTETPFDLGAVPFQGKFAGMLMSINQPGLYFPGSSVGWGRNGSGQANVAFTTPASYVIVDARNGLNPAFAFVFGFNGVGAVDGPVQLSDNAFQPIAFAGDVRQLQLENTTDGAASVIGRIRARSFDVVTRFEGAAFDSNRGTANFMLGAAPFEAEFDGRIISVGVASLYVGASLNSFGVSGAGTATIRFDDAPARFVSMQTRGTDAASGQGVADASVSAFGPAGLLETVPLQNDAFTTLSFSGEITRVEITNASGSGLGLISEFAAQGNTLHTRFDGTFGATTFDTIRNTPTQFTLTAGTARATFDGTVLFLNLPGLYIAPSPNAWGVTGDGTASIAFPQGVGVVTGRVRGTGADVGLPDASATLTARDASDTVLGTFDVPIDEFGYFHFSGAIASLELTNAGAGSSALIGEITALRTG